MFLIGMQNFIGFFDIAIIIAFLIAIFIGIIFGFFNGLLKVANFFFSLVVSWFLAKPFSKLVGLFLRRPIYNHFYKKAYNSKSLSAIGTSDNPDEALENELSKYPKFVARYVRKIFSVGEDETIRESIANSISNGITRMILIVISFILLTIIIVITVAILKKTIGNLREESKGFKIFDNILGVIFNCLFMFCIITIIVYICSKISPLDSFMTRDMRLDERNGIPFGRLFYEHNILGNILDLFI